MALAMTINGADVLDYLEPGPGNPGMDQTLQARTVMRFVLKDRSGLYRPIIRQEVIVTVDGVRIFGGVISSLDEGDWGDYRGIWFNVEAADWTQILETMFFNGIAVGVTLKDVVQHLVTARLAARGFSVHPDQAAGPLIGSQGYSFRYISEIFDDLSKISTWPWTCDEFKRIRFAPAGALPAPFDLTATNDTINSIRVASTIDGYVNVVWLHYGAAGIREIYETWYATAGQTTFDVVEFPNPEGITAGPTEVLVNGASEAVGDATAPWSWSVAVPPAVPSYGRLTRNAGGLAGGTFVEARYSANFPAAINEGNAEEIALYGEAAYIETADDIFDVRQARQYAQGVLRQRGGLLRRISATTHRPGLKPGLAPIVDVPERAISEACLVLSSRLIFDGRRADTGEDYWRFDLDLVEGTEYVETWQKFFRDITRQSTGAAVSAGGSVGPPSGGGGGGGSATPLPSSVFYRYLGGSRQVAGIVPTSMSADPWVAIPEFADAFVNFDDLGGRTVQVTIQTRTMEGGVSVTPRVVSVDGSGNRALVLATGTPSSGLGSWIYQGITIPPGAASGLTPIRVEFTTGTLGRPVWLANAALNVFGAVAASAVAPEPAESEAAA